MDLLKIRSIPNKLQLYENKAESIFKTLAITMSWIGGVHLSKEPKDGITKTIGITFYLFSLSLIMEYVVALVQTKKGLGKVYPFFICMMNCFTLVSTFAILVDRPIIWVEYEHINFCSIASLGIIWIDMITTLLFRTNNSDYIENNLKNI